MYGVSKQVKCTENGFCSQTVVTMVIIDECPTRIFSGTGKRHFDLSGTSFTDMVSPSTTSTLINAGVILILF